MDARKSSHAALELGTFGDLLDAWRHVAFAMNRPARFDFDTSPSTISVDLHVNKRTCVCCF